MREKNTICKCWETGKYLLDNWNKIADEHQLNAKMSGYPIRMHLECYVDDLISPELKALILQEMVKKGIFMSPSWVALSYSHSKEDIDLTLRMFDLVCRDVKKRASNQNYKNLIEGSMPKTVWMMTIKPTKKPANRLDTKC